MTKRSFARFAEPVTWFRNSLRTDPFFAARLKILGLYFVTGAAMFIGMGFISDYSLRQEVYHIAVSQNGAPVRAAFKGLRQDLWTQRLTLVLLFACAAFIITEFVLRPIKKSAEIQRRFVAIVSHELRTPLTIMKNVSEIGLRNKSALSQEKAVSIIESNLEEINRMSDTINFLLSFSVLIERNEITSMQAVSLEVIAKEVVAVVEKRYQERGVAITLLATNRGEIQGDATALKGLLFNLIENAIMHTPRGGKVAILVRRQGRQVIVSVSDTGYGISKKDLPYIFEPFYRGSQSEEAEESSKGMGLGLSLAKEVAELHYGSVSVLSAKGRGTTFTVTFRT
jgi:signal transduction histidine kinase